jgi:hypothetical protein
MLAMHEIKKLQKTVVLGTAHILRKVSVEKNNRFNLGNSVIFTVISKYRIAAILYTLETWEFSGI